jgi:hypothetical protein
MKAAAVAAVLAAALASGCAPEAAEPAPFLDPSELEYVSDYVSFMGRDDRGAVAFALDVNRGRAAETRQLELFGVLWDEGEGWQHVAGLGDLPHPRSSVRMLPDTAGFVFTGTTRTHLRIDSPPNGLTLEIDTVRTAVVRTTETGRFVLGSAPATLRLGDREIRGRVIHEALARRGWNRLVHEEDDLWDAFHGIYLLAGDDGDVYFHTRGGTGHELTGAKEGFARIDGETTRLDEAAIEVTRWTERSGEPRWPDDWTARWDDGEAKLEIRTISRKVVDVWDDGGFAMGIVAGTLTRGGETVPVIGFSEILD